MIDEGEGVDGWVDVEPQLLERKGRRSVESMLELAKESLVVLCVSRYQAMFEGRVENGRHLEHIADRSA